jgi:hypothetical protein
MGHSATHPKEEVHRRHLPAQWLRINNASSFKNLMSTILSANRMLQMPDLILPLIPLTIKVSERKM